jgi:hypothetical protein
MIYRFRSVELEGVGRMRELELAIEYFEDAVREIDKIMEECSEDLKANLAEQKEYFITALEAMKKAEQKKGCYHCRGWDSRCGAKYCPMCGRKL